MRRKLHPSEVEAADVAEAKGEKIATGDTFAWVYKDAACYMTSGYLQKGTIRNTEAISVKE